MNSHLTHLFEVAIVLLYIFTKENPYSCVNQKTALEQLFGIEKTLLAIIELRMRMCIIRACV